MLVDMNGMRDRKEDGRESLDINRVERERGRADSRALRHTPEKTERTRRLVLVYGSQNENVEETRVPVCVPRG